MLYILYMLSMLSMLYVLYRLYALCALSLSSLQLSCRRCNDACLAPWTPTLCLYVRRFYALDALHALMLYTAELQTLQWRLPTSWTLMIS